jgi:zinc protease
MSALPAVLVLMALQAAAAAGDGARPPLSVPYETFRLANGLTVIVHEDHTAPLVSVNTYYHVGSGRERPGRTGFAHLFEHLMFEGSKNVPEGAFDQWLEAAGGSNNGSTNGDRTNYWENAPAGALELPLFLESDRMGFLLDAMSPEKVNGQRDVVKNERRQSYENRPYGMADLAIPDALYQPDHP